MSEKNMATADVGTGNNGAQVVQELAGMKVGYTKVVNGAVVTRWGSNKFEVGTYGKATFNQLKTASQVAEEIAAK